MSLLLRSGDVKHIIMLFNHLDDERIEPGGREQ